MEEKIEKELKWAVLGTGIIANEMAGQAHKVRGGEGCLNRLLAGS